MTYEKGNIAESGMKGHPDENAKALYVDWLRGIADKPHQDLLDHVADCEQCKSEILETAGLLDDLDQEAKQNKQQNRLLIIRSAAALFVVFIVAMMIQFLKPGNEKAELAGVHADSLILTRDTAIVSDSLKTDEQGTSIIREVIIIVHDTIKYAANYLTNPAFDVLVNANFRSGHIVLQQEWPKDTVLVRGSRWTLKGGEGLGENAEIVLLSNKGKVLKNSKFSHYQAALSMNFEPGLYYWKVLSEDELIRIGRIRLFSALD